MQSIKLHSSLLSLAVRHCQDERKPNSSEGGSGVRVSAEPSTAAAATFKTICPLLRQIYMWLASNPSTLGTHAHLPVIFICLRSNVICTVPIDRCTVAAGKYKLCACILVLHEDVCVLKSSY